ncbi:MAG: hypothetical protein CSA68_04305 [Rhodobacterales bacterium]|nr:MAG: hypothetical protein CSA68_04305 [Rhodobacterales bacterium]
MEETAHSIAKITEGQADTAKQQSVAERAFPEASVTGHAGSEAGWEFLDLDLRHVLAAAINDLGPNDSDGALSQNCQMFDLLKGTLWPPDHRDPTQHPRRPA